MLMGSKLGVICCDSDVAITTEFHSDIERERENYKSYT